MPGAMNDLLAVYVDGETKTGKGAASKAIATALTEENLKVYYDIAGDFYRRFVALVRIRLGLDETDVLPTGKVLEVAARAVYETKQPFEPNDTLGDLQRPAISQSVSVLGELPLAQKAGAEWWAMTLQLAQQADADMLVVDGRNPRSRVRDAAIRTGINVRTALDLYMTCEALEAGRRTLRVEGIKSPTDEQLEIARQKVVLRRSRDRERPDYPFIVPSHTLPFEPSKSTASEIVRRSWDDQSDDLPITITLDNTHFTEPEMLSAVRALASAAVAYIKR